MAKAKEEFRGCSSLEEELSCPICLCLYRNPVALTCGHSFCKQCIQNALGAQQKSKAPYSCPMCKVQLGPILELHKNFQLCSIVETFMNTKGKQDEGFTKEKEEVVACDFCLDQPQPAMKTCLICDASLCQAHLDKHNAKASQKDHILVEVGTGSSTEDRRCREHGRALECYCEDEEEPICMLCSIAGYHKGHSILTLKEAHNKQLDVLSHTMNELQEHKSAIATALGELQRNENQLKTNTKTVTSELQKLFEEIKTLINQEEKKIFSGIQSNEESQLADIAKLKKEVEQKRSNVVQHLQSLQKMRQQPDTFLFFKEFKLALDRIKSQSFNTRRIDVSVVQLDQATINSHQMMMLNYVSQLDLLLQAVHSQLANQIQWDSGASDAGISSNYTYERLLNYPFRF